MLEVYVALAALAGLSLLAILGLYHNAFEDNWLQCVGLVVVGFAAAMFSLKVYDRARISPELFWLILGTFFYGCGVAMKVRQHMKRAPQGR